jgi:putative transposase
MAQRRFSRGEVSELLGRAEALTEAGLSWPKAAVQLGVKYCTLYQWRRQAQCNLGGELRRLKELEAENMRLRRALGAFRRAARVDLKLVKA